jgi:hypothetical protein
MSMKSIVRDLISVAAILLALSSVGRVDAEQSDFCRKLVAGKPYIKLSPALAQNLLIQKSDPVIPHYPMAARVTGTAVVLFELGTHGEVLCPIVISGPKMLRKPALDAVRKYKYRPYLLHGRPVVAETSTSVVFTLGNQ